MPTDLEQHDSQRRTAPTSKVHSAILREGEEELERPSSALFWSALAAGSLWVSRWPPKGS